MTATPTDTEAIRRKLALIRKAAEYLRGYARDVEESQSADNIIRRTREIEALLPAREDQAA